MFGNVLDAPAAAAAVAAAAASVVAGYLRQVGDRWLEGLNLEAGCRVVCWPPAVLHWACCTLASCLAPIRTWLALVQ